MTPVSWATYKPQTKHGETPRGESLTAPNLALSPTEILLRFTQGRPLPQLVGSYIDDDVPDIETMDLSEIKDYSDNLTARIAALEKTIEDDRATRFKAKEDERIEKEVRKRLKKSTDSNPDPIAV